MKNIDKTGKKLMTTQRFLPQFLLFCHLLLLFIALRIILVILCLNFVVFCHFSVVQFGHFLDTKIQKLWEKPLNYCNKEHFLQNSVKYKNDLESPINLRNAAKVKRIPNISIKVHQK